MNVNLNVYPYCHSFYQEIIDNPPEGIEYSGLFEFGTKSYVADGNLSTKAVLFLENQAKRIWKGLNKPSMRPALTGDLVHSERLVFGNQPYVTSFDHIGFLTDYDFDQLYQLAEDDTFDRYLAQERCRKLLPWSDAAAKSFRAVIGDQFDNLLEVVYPAVSPIETTATHTDGPLEMLFVATDFYLKGGAELMAAYDELQTRIDVKLTVISNVPRKVRSKYKQDQNVRFEMPTFDREELYKSFYSESNVLVQPTHNDSFGMVFLEAMNAGLPVVTTDVFATPEIVEDGKTGYVVDKPEVCLFSDDQMPNPHWSANRSVVRRRLRTAEPEVVNSLVERLEQLSTDPKLCRNLGEAGRERICSGRFSIEHRNNRLQEVYTYCCD